MYIKESLRKESFGPNLRRSPDSNQALLIPGWQLPLLNSFWDDHPATKMKLETCAVGVAI